MLMTLRGPITFRHRRAGVSAVAQATNFSRARFATDSAGTTSVEMGFIGGLFVLFLCIWVELGLTLFMQSALDRAVRKESRLIRTGTITSSAASTFTTKICNDMMSIIDCSKLQVNVAAGTSFASLSAAYTTDTSDHLITTGFNTGMSGQDVVVQVGYTRALYLPIVSAFLGKNNNVLIVSSIAFQNEPF
jgi:Flp pilus assembly protein TadG